MSKVTTVFTTAFKKYDTALIVNPYRTKMLTNILIFGAADTICQTVFEKSSIKTFDFQRLGNMMLIGCFFVAPIGHLWYCKWAPSLIPRVTMNPKIQPVIGMLADQLIFAPPFVSSFLFLNDYLKNFSAKKAAENVKEKIWTGMKANWKLWPPVQLINFSIVPIQFRVPFVNFVSLFWTIYLSYLQNNKI